jgi:hypothetical protein
VTSTSQLPNFLHDEKDGRNGVANGEMKYWRERNMENT